MSLRVFYDILNQKGTPAFYTDTLANRPAFGFAGRVFISTDSGQIFEDTGSAWTLIADAGVGGGTLSSVCLNGNTTATGITITAGGLSSNSLTNTSNTAGSVLFAGAGGLESQSNSTFFWDNTNKRLGINNASPGAPLDIHGTGTQIQVNGTGTNNSYIQFQNAGVSKWRIGNTYSGGLNTLDIYNNGLANTTLSFNVSNNAATFSGGIYTNTGWVALKQNIGTANTTNYLTLNASSTGGSSESLILGLSSGAVMSLNFSTGSNYTYTFPNATGTIALTSNLSSYLPLSGGTMTGNVIYSGCDILLNNNRTISGQLFGTSSYANMLCMTAANKVQIDANAQGTIIGGNASFSGTVSIGNTNTTYNLDVTGTGRFTGILYDTISADGYISILGGNTPKLNIYQFSTGNVMNFGHNFYYDGTTYGLNDATKMGWQVRTHITSPRYSIYSIAAGTTTQTERLGIDGSTGAVGVNTGSNTLVAQFTSYSTTQSNQIKAAGTAPGITFSDATNSVTYGGAVGVATGANNFITGSAAGDMAITNQSATAGNLLFGIGTSEKMRLTTGGNLLIGTTSGTNKLQVGSTSYGSNDFAMGNGAIDFAIDLTTTAVDIYSSAGFRFLSTTGIYNLTMHSTGYLISIPTYNNTTGTAANMVVLSDGQLCRSTSSLKYKRDVRDYDKGLDIVSQIRPVYYKGKSENDGDIQYAGLIAEEIHNLGLTEFVQYTEDGTPDALAYQNMIALLIKAIQELNNKLVRNNIN